MIAGNIQIASPAAPNTAGAAATSKSPVPAADFQSAFHQHMRNELGKLANCPLGGTWPADSAKPAKDATTGKPAKKPMAASLPGAAAAPDEAAALPQLRSLPSFPPPGASAASGSSTSATQPDPCPAQVSESCLVNEIAGRVHSAAQEKLQAPAEMPDSLRSSAGSAASAGSARQNPVDNVPRSQPEPPKAAQEGQPRSSAQAVPIGPEKAEESRMERQDAAASLSPGNSGNETALDSESTSTVAAQPTSALPPPQLSAALDPVLPPSAAQNQQAGRAELAGGDAFAQLVDGVSTVKQSPSDENSQPRKDAAGGRGNAVDARAKTAPATPERKAAETGASRIPDAVGTEQPREQAAPARASDAAANSSFTQALAAERSKPPATEANTQQPERSASAATLDHAPVASDEPNALHLQSARLTGNDLQAEMQMGLHTADYGHVEIKTTLQNSALGATIAVEHTALREQIVSALPELRHSLTERQITLDSLTVNDSLSATTSFTNSHQQRSNQQQSAVPYQGSQERPAEPDWKTKSGALSGPVLQPWGGDSGSELNVLV